jgi:galactose-1-phosphate uridylyltransferase
MIDKPFIVVNAYDKDVGDSVISYLHYFKDPTPILENSETRRLLAEAIAKVFKFFRKYHPLIGNVVQVQFDLTPEELERRIRRILNQGETQ